MVTLSRLSAESISTSWVKSLKLTTTDSAAIFWSSPSRRWTRHSLRSYHKNQSWIIFYEFQQLVLSVRGEGKKIFDRATDVHERLLITDSSTITVNELVKEGLEIKSVVTKKPNAFTPLHERRGHHYTSTNSRNVTLKLNTFTCEHFFSIASIKNDC